MAMKILLFLSMASVLCELTECYEGRFYNRLHSNYHHVAGNWGAWGEYGACSRTCGGGEQRRYRLCETKATKGYSRDIRRCAGSNYSRRMCNFQCCPVDGVWSLWSSWVSQTERFYKQMRTRYCRYENPRCQGKSCVGADKQTQSADGSVDDYMRGRRK
ncbi:HMCN1 [Bugula neritina]|uniref:HMCN1 n=1 Tax=Bugula neritina TaxID=10212 RepID=A0A7J7J5W8_BUGNE|nr:HMCN1 [Bugula neritina]